MALRTPEAPERNPTQEIYDEGFNASGLSDAEKGRLGGVYAKNQEDIDARRESMDSLRNSEQNMPSIGGNKDVQDQEESPTYGSGWENKTTPKSPSPQKLSVAGLLRGKKNKSTVTAVIVLLVIGGIFGLSFVTPGLLLIHMKETITDRFNTQLASMDVRTEKLLIKKLSGSATSGFCASKVTIRCKFTSLNDKQVANFERAGIKVVSGGETVITGRAKPASLEFRGKTITAATLRSEMRASPEFRSALNAAYNPKMAGFADKIWGKLATRLDISKKPLLDSSVATDEERMAKIQESTKSGRGSGGTGVYKEVDENGKKKWVNDEGDVVDKETALKRNAELADIEGRLNTGVDGVIDSGKKSGGALLEADEVVKAAKQGISTAKVTGFFSLWGVADSACSIYGGIQAVGYGAKVLRAAQMARYAMNYLTIADAMKAGTASPEDVAYYAGVLTRTTAKEIFNEKTKEFEKVTTKSATDSYGYRYAAYGDVGPPSASATQFLAGGGLGGELSGVANKVLEYLPGGPDVVNDTCDTLRNPFVQATGIIAAVALMVIPGGQLALTAKTSAQIAVSVALGAATIILPNLLDDIVAGVLIDDSVFGELAGDAFVSGSGVIMSGLAGLGGNAPLRPEQAVAYAGMQNEVIARYAEQDRLDSSPLDASNPHTFMGKFASQLLPYSVKEGSVTGYATTTASIIAKSFSSIVSPSAKALSAEDYMLCQDYDYRELNLATDPFCNPIRGIPPQYLDVDPLDVLDYLDNNEHIDEDSGEPKSKEYKDFVKNCIDREEPFGRNGQSDSTGEGCFIPDGNTDEATKKAYFYLNHIDRRVLDGMENGYELGKGAGSSAADMSNWPTAEDINKLVERAEKGTGNSSPLHGKGGAFIELGKKYGINPGIIAAILYRESQMGADGSVLPNQYNNFAGITDAGGNAPGPCGSTPVVVDRTWKNFCTPEEGLEGVFKILDLDIYRNTSGTMAEVMELYSPKFENDWTDMWNIFHVVADELKIAIEESTNIYSSAFAAGESAGLLAIAGSSVVEALYEFNPGGIDDCELYGYGAAYGTNGCQHTGTDIVLPKHAPIYSPVSGTVTCSKTGSDPGTNGGGCSSFNSYPPDDVRHGRIEIELDNGDALILGHISTSLVKLGDRVSIGQQVGTNGYMNSWHVHVEYRTPDSSTSSGWRVINPADGLGGVTTPRRTAE